MKEKYKLLKGRPSMKVGKRTRKIDVRFTEEEFALILEMEKILGLKRTDLIRTRVLQSSKVIINAREFIVQLDQLGTELGRIGNNINQLARYANTLNKRSLLSPQIIERYNVLLAEFIKIEHQLEITLRKVIRSMTK
ncbi:plasmid mobilization relaxosome protein MobC [Pedobacter ginsengisoli]|uniref:Plasmid mobilization relaxosome protein MobC n=1 Tax=Pedobacter ginsengisoli TaxID=363852 RepID=A0A2D1U3Q0_9SPHI|nr:plasmid mobilization relaxosome protein MobC [Pedobacter ginsengisoli]ATP56239.1 plasmid mobilization relaxosome protein MobC [Pedobacter ginsengisoli]